jgi:signal transduction histidine kinase
MDTNRALMAAVMAAVPLGLAVAGGLLMVAAGTEPDPAVGDLGMNVVVAVAFPVVGAVIYRHRPGHVLAWVYAAAGLGAATTMFTYGYARFGLASAGLPGHLAAAWVSSWVWTTGVPALLTFGLLLFPDGRLPSRRWRAVAAAALGGMILLALPPAVAPGALVNHPEIVNPLGVPAAAALVEPLGTAGFVAFVAAFLGAAVSLVVRWRAGNRSNRRQLRWLLYAVSLLVLAFALDALAPSLAASVVSVAAVAFLPVAVGIAIVRERLYDIDVLISRSLVYGVLSAGVIVTYIVVVAAVGGLLGRRAGLVGPLVATGVVAVAFQPAREILQRRVSRWVYGPRADPYAALARLARRLENTTEPAAVLSTVVDTVATELRLPYAAIEVAEDGEFRPVASHGLRPSRTTVLLLTHQGHTIGRMVIGETDAGGGLIAPQRRLLEDLARQASIALYAVRVTAALQRSRSQLINAREEERRRLHRDLHDGLGPTLAAMTLQLDVLRRVINDDAAAAKTLVDQLKAEVQAAVPEIRRLVYELRPPALDELGLVAALRQYALAAAGADRAGEDVTVSVLSESDLPPLPAATEVAAYRIATEAITNALRHAHPRRCTVRLECEGELRLAISDDGHGIPDVPPAGIGLRSMRERAAELGGHCVVERRPQGGTLVRALLPVEPR